MNLRSAASRSRTWPSASITFTLARFRLDMTFSCGSVGNRYCCAGAGEIYGSDFAYSHSTSGFGRSTLGPCIAKSATHQGVIVFSRRLGGALLFAGLVRCAMDPSDAVPNHSRRIHAMEFRLSPEEEDLRRRVAEFVRDELIPWEPEFDHAPDMFEGSRWKSLVKSSPDTEIQRYLKIMEELERKAEGQGLWYLDVPKTYGGMEVSNVAMIAITEELEKCTIPFEFGNHVSNILFNCSGEQIDKYLWPCIRGEKTSAFGLSEPASGADPSM